MSTTTTVLVLGAVAVILGLYLWLVANGRGH